MENKDLKSPYMNLLNDNVIQFSIKDGPVIKLDPQGFWWNGHLIDYLYKWLPKTVVILFFMIKSVNPSVASF